jgi:arabinose-5-phosphate isomerase
VPVPDRRATDEILEIGRRVIRVEAKAVSALAERLDGAFAEAARLLSDASGRVIASGIGKSGIIARKIAATLTSTGTPATFLHPVEGMHGDLGLVGAEDVALLVSKSGETPELAGLVDYFARLSVPIVILTGHPESSLARDATVVLDCSVAEEACPMGLAPTTSTTAALAMGDALAVAVLEGKGLDEADFALLHPGGHLGRRLTLRVQDVMVTGDEVPILSPGALVRESIVPLAERRGTVAVVGRDGKLAGVFTAGDLTRLMERDSDFLEVSLGDVMTTNPRVASPGELGSAAVGRMEEHGVMALPVLDGEQRLKGMVHLHDLMRSGAV